MCLERVTISGLSVECDRLEVRHGVFWVNAQRWNGKRLGDNKLPLEAGKFPTRNIRGGDQTNFTDSLDYGNIRRSFWVNLIMKIWTFYYSYGRVARVSFDVHRSSCLNNKHLLIKLIKNYYPKVLSSSFDFKVVLEPRLKMLIIFGSSTFIVTCVTASTHQHVARVCFKNKLLMLLHPFLKQRFVVGFFNMNYLLLTQRSFLSGFTGSLKPSRFSFNTRSPHNHVQAYLILTMMMMMMLETWFDY